MLWDHEIADIVRGYYEENNSYICLICGQKFEQGQIYPEDGAFFDAPTMARRHVEHAHGSMSDYLLKQELSATGLTEVQRQLLQMAASGKSDADIARDMGITASTVRNHRFKLREKEKQAKLFLALMADLEKHTKQPIGHSNGVAIAEAPITAKMVDERYNITEDKRKKAIDTYFDAKTGALKQFPAREKKKIIVLSEIAKNFKPDQTYSEKEVNRVLQRIYEEDYVSLRRYLIEYGFMERTSDGKAYRVKA